MNFPEDGRWQELYLAVMSESNEADRRRKAQIADAVMRRRGNALKRRRDTESILEAQAVTAALEKLANLMPQEAEPQVLKMQEQESTGRKRATE